MLILINQSKYATDFFKNLKLSRGMVRIRNEIKIVTFHICYFLVIVLQYDEAETSAVG